MGEEGKRNLDKIKDIGEKEDRILVVEAERKDGGRDRPLCGGSRENWWKDWLEMGIFILILTLIIRISKKPRTLVLAQQVSNQRQVVWCFQILSIHIDYRNTEVLYDWWSLCPKTSSRGLFNEMINQFLFLRYSRAADTDDKYTAHCLNATRCYIVLLVVLVV